jgi:hypothetical protein
MAGNKAVPDKIKRRIAEVSGLGLSPAEAAQAAAALSPC